MQNHIFNITSTRDFLQHFLTNWRTKSISPEMVEKLKENSESDPYAAYGYGRWLSLVNPDGKSIRKAELLLTWAGSNGVQDANAALARMYYEGRIEADEAMPQMHAFMLDSAYKLGSELAQYQTLENLIYGEYGVRKDPALAADILRKHLEKNPESDPIYYDLLGRALESSDPESAEKAYISSLERGNTESYYSLANFYRTRREESRACAIAEEGARLGAVNCRRFKAGMECDDFLALSPEERTILHQEIDEGLDYAIARHDGFACYLKGALLFLGHLGYSENHEEALRPLSRGCELGKANCFWLKAYIQHIHGDNLSDEMKSSAQDIARACLQAARLGDREGFTLEQVARGYVTGLLSKYEKEIERLWLKEYLAANPEEDDTKDCAAVTLVYPQGFYYAMDVEEGEDDLDLEALSSRTEARGYDVVHYSPILNRITKTLALDKESCHLAMLVDKDGLMRDLPDNMVGTLVYGQGQEIRGTVVFVLEDDNTYRLMPMKGLQRIYMFLQMLGAATGDLMRQPSSEELEAIGVEDSGGFEEYDDPDILDDESGQEQEIEEDMAAVDTSREEEPRELVVPVAEVKEGINNCNLCIDTLIVTLPDSREFWFKSNDDLILELGIKSTIEENITRHGGYMIDGWQYVDTRQIPIDIRSHICFKFTDEQ